MEWGADGGGGDETTEEDKNSGKGEPREEENPGKRGTPGRGEPREEGNPGKRGTPEVTTNRLSGTAQIQAPAPDTRPDTDTV